MIESYNSRFVKFYHNKEEGILQQIWTYTHHQNNLHFYQSINQLLTIIDECNASRILIDFSNFTFCLTTEDQQRLKKTVFSRFKKSKVQKIAVINSGDKPTQESLITLFEAGIEKPITYAFYDNIKEATQYLAEKTQTTTLRIQQVTKKVMTG